MTKRRRRSDAKWQQQRSGQGAHAFVGVAELCREHGMSDATFYEWRAKFGGIDVPMMARMKELEEEDRRLKKMYAEEELKAEIRKEAARKL